ncbi:NAD(P)/FAD-dependent oxidoreductase [Thermoleophilia bacterium SCSIO 60948]|nr:NAD(P)/FAD-dependent oxidoreductase [Thermoleophilia bacterium SCSIO 60948]
MAEAFVVGSGPNGLACAAALATRGVRVTVVEAAERIGGGTRTSELTLPGLLHDECSAFHPMALGSKAIVDQDLARHGLEWLWPEIDLAHPLDDGGAAAMHRSIDRTAAGLGADGAVWKRLFARPSRGFEALSEDVMRPVLHLPRHPLRLARFGIPAALPATVLARSFPTARGRALFGGSAAHAFSRLDTPMSAAVGVALICSSHAYGWPVARGGSRAISDALAAVVVENGGSVETGRRVRSLGELPKTDAVVLDLAPRGVVEVAGDRLPVRVRRAYERYRHGPGAFKLDLAVEGGIPWTAEEPRRAGSVHLGGTMAEIAAAERDVNRSRMPERPFVLVGQQYLADPSRSNGDTHPIWAYAHVPHGYEGDATEPILGQLERFAPGVRERVLAIHSTSPAQIEAQNPNLIGGDIITGANTPVQTLIRPRLALDPYRTGVPGVWVCSAATPPGAGAHGMNGWNAAMSVLGELGD